MHKLIPVTPKVVVGKIANLRACQPLRSDKVSSVFSWIPFATTSWSATINKHWYSWICPFGFSSVSLSILMIASPVPCLSHKHSSCPLYADCHLTNNQVAFVRFYLARPPTHWFWQYRVLFTTLLQGFTLISFSFFAPTWTWITIQTATDPLTLTFST